MNKKIVIGIIAISMLLGLYLYTNPNNEEIEHTQVVTIGQLPLIGNWPLYMAEEQGYFEDKNITVQYENIQTSNQIMDALIRNDVQVGYLASLPVLAAQGTSPDQVQVFAFGDYSIENPFDALLVKKGSSIKSLKDLEGKKIGVFPGTTSTNFTKQYLKNENIDVIDIQFVQTPPAAMLQALDAGSIDALHAYEVNVAAGVDNGTAEILQSAIFGHVLDHAAIGIVAANSDWIKENPKLAKNFIDAFQKGLNYGQKNPEETRSLIQKRLNLSETVAKDVTVLDFSMYNEYDADLFKELANISEKIGDLTSSASTANLIYRK